MTDVEWAVTRLTETHAVTVDGTIAECEPLILMLKDARYPNLGRTKGGGGTGDMLDMKALTMYETIDAGVRTWLDHYRRPHDGGLLELVKRLHETLTAEYAGDRLEDPDRMFAMFPTWVQRIEDLLDPPREWELTEPCPECGEHHSTDEDGGQKWAVRVPVKEGRAIVAECHECGRMWAGQAALAELAQSMGIEVNWDALRDLTGHAGKVDATV